MKHLLKLTSIAALLVMMTQPIVLAQDTVFTTGSDWVEKMSVREKLMSLIPPTLLMRRFGITTRYAGEEYVDAIDKLLEYHPELLNEDVSNIYVSTVYVVEPETRPALEAMERELRYRDSGHNPDYFPRLLIRRDGRRDL